MHHTMNSDQILEAIESIAKTSGKNDKIAMVKTLAGSADFMRVMKAALNETISYGIKKIPDRPTDLDPAGATIDETTWGIIDAMRNRTLTGGLMLATVEKEMFRLSAQSAELFKRILLKDLRAGFTAETVNKVAPGSLPDFPYQRCSLPKDAKPGEWDEWDKGHISQEKADGMFANVDHEDTDEVFIYSRQGSMFPMDKFANLEHSIKSALQAGTQSHGEMLVVRDGVVLAREIGNGVLNSVLKGGDFADNEHPVFMVWDQIPLTEVKPKGKYSVPYFERLKDLVMQLREAQNDMVRLIPTKIVKSLPEAYGHAGEIMKRGGEGTILKRRSAIWKDGTSKEQVKLKLEFTVDLEITAVQPGDENTKNAGRPGALTCATSDGELVVNVAIKGEKMRDLVEANPDDWIGRIMPVTANLVLKPSESSDKHSLFLPRFAEAHYRTDKSVADSLRRVFDQQEAAIFGVAIKSGEALKEAA